MMAKIENYAKIQQKKAIIQNNNCLIISTNLTGNVFH